LKLVAASDAAPEWTWFCGHCAVPSPTGAPPAPYSRVCSECGLGLLLETLSGAVPEPDEAFLVVDSSLLVQGLSRRAEKLLGLSEELAVNRLVSDLLVVADADPSKPSAFAEAITDTMTSEPQVGRAFVRPWNTYGVRMRVRIAPCGPPRAALLVLEVGPHLRAIDGK
jgi:PAS domain-containing protein